LWFVPFAYGLGLAIVGSNLESWRPKQFSDPSVVRGPSMSTHEDKMRSILLATALLSVLQATTSTPSAAAKRQGDGVRSHTNAHHRYKKDRSSRHGASVHTGMASYYWQPQGLSSGGSYNSNAMTAAHRTLPFGTRVRVTHAGNGRSVEVRINDRGPFTAGRIIDLSTAAGRAIGLGAQGVARVTIAVLGR
jgi:rare lipoprotein A (peptidoglycan hydrolase)